MNNSSQRSRSNKGWIEHYQLEWLIAYPPFNEANQFVDAAWGGVQQMHCFKSWANGFAENWILLYLYSLFMVKRPGEQQYGNQTRFLPQQTREQFWEDFGC